MSIEEEVLAKVKPTPQDEERIKLTVSKLKERVEATKSAEVANFESCLVGSIAKDTHLKDPDIDLFLLFDPAVPREEMDKLGVAIGHEAIDGREHYAEHPYIRGEFEGMKVDIVPAYKITDSSQKMTAVDRTPFHTRYVTANLAEEKQDDVRLLKQFMKGIGEYGAEAKVEGFSGYLCELLILRFGGFKQALEAVHTWKRGEILFMGQDPGTRFDSTLTFIDPVDDNRNVASAVSIDSLSRFIVAAGFYLADPKQEFFFPNEPEVFSPDDIKARLNHKGGLLTVTVAKPDIIDDILYPQIRKAQRSIIQYLASKDFEIITSRSGVYGGYIVILIELKHFELPISFLHKGPPVWISENAGQFLSKWKDSPSALSKPFVKNGHWNVFVRRKHTNALELVNNDLTALDIGKDLNKLKQEVCIHGPGVVDEPAIIKALSEFLDKRMSWER